MIFHMTVPRFLGYSRVLSRDPRMRVVKILRVENENESFPNKIES